VPESLSTQPAVHPSARPSVRPSADIGMLLVCLIWGVNFAVTKLAIDQMPALPFTAIRFVLASGLLWLVVRLIEPPAPLAPGDLWRLVALGVVGNTLYQLAFILGLAHTTAGNSSLILATVPTVVAVFAWMLGLERVTPRMWAGIVIGTAGVVLVIVAGGVEFTARTLRGDFLTVAAVLCWAGYTLGLRFLPKGLSPLRVTSITTIAGMPGLLLAGLPGLLVMKWKAIPGTAWSALAYATLLSLVVAYILWNRSVKAVGGTRTAIYMCVTPLVALGAAWLILGEQLRPLQGVGAVMIIGDSGGRAW